MKRMKLEEDWIMAQKGLVFLYILEMVSGTAVNRHSRKLGVVSKKLGVVSKKCHEGIRWRSFHGIEPKFPQNWTKVSMESTFHGNSPDLDVLSSVTDCSQSPEKLTVSSNTFDVTSRGPISSPLQVSIAFSLRKHFRIDADSILPLWRSSSCESEDKSKMLSDSTSSATTSRSPPCATLSLESKHHLWVDQSTQDQ